MALAVVRSLSSARSRRHGEDEEEFELELIDQYAIACAAAGTTDESVAQDRAAIFEFVRFLARRLWTAVPDDADGYLSWLRGARGQARSTVQGKAGALARFYEFVINRYQGDIHALFGCVVVQPIDEFNRPTNVANNGAVRVPPSDEEVRVLFEGWRDGLAEARKFLPAARDYLAASLWRRVGLRINETVMLDVRDWRPELGELGKLHIRFGKGSRGRGAKTRMVPAINEVAALIEWWLVEVRHQFGDDWDAPDAPMFPSERRDSLTGHCARIGAEALRAGLSGAVEAWLPAWSGGRLGPHGLRHYCASSLYQRGVGLKAIQELLGHEWLSTTTKYIHVHTGHIEALGSADPARLGRRGTPVAAGTPRATLGAALRSIFGTLKAHKVIFTNPMAGISVGNFTRRTPLPLDHHQLRAPLNSPDPAGAAAAALLIFHGLRPDELRDLTLTDVRDGRLHLSDRVVPMAEPVQQRLAGYFEHRHRRWPGSVNPHFFIHHRSATGTEAVKHYWVNDRLGMRAFEIRQHRIVDEVLATAGDLRRICDFFGVTMETAAHYASVLNHPGLATVDHPDLGSDAKPET